MLIENPIGGRRAPLDPALAAALPKLEYLVVADHYENTPLSEHAHAVLPLAMAMEKDGTFTAHDRTVQRLRAAVPAMGEAKSGTEIVARIARRMGYGLEDRHPAHVMAEIARVVPGYSGISYARLERHGINVPTAGVADPGSPIYPIAADASLALSPRLVPASPPRS
jgi:predicted molibdopterin-dependent oxidoreductase YjgC